MARNFMGDYDPGNTTGWKNTGQVETYNPSTGGTTTSFDTNPNTNPSYDPNAKRHNPIERKKEVLKQNLENKYAKLYDTNKFSWKNPIKKHNAWSKKKALDWAKKQEYEKKLGLMELGLSNYEIGQLTGEYADMAKNVSAITGKDALTMNNLKDYFAKGTSKYNKGVLDLAPMKHEKYLDQTPSLDSRITLPGMLSKFQGPVNINNFKSSINRLGQIDDMVAAGIDQNAINDYYDKAMGRGDYNIFGPDQSGDNNNMGYMGYPSYEAWAAANLGGGVAEEVVEEKTITPWDFTQKVGADVTNASYVANGGRVPAAGGGIMNVVPRQGFFLGKIAKGIGKAVGSVAKAAGKVLKSDVGKMALLYGAGAMAGSYGLKGSLFSKGMFNPMNMKAGLFGASNVALNKLGLTEMAAKKGLLAKLGLTQGYGSLLPTWKGGIAALTALPLLGIGTEAKQDTMPGGSDRGGHLKDSQGNEALPADLRAEVRAAYESGDPDKIKAIQDYYTFLPGLNAVRLPDIKPYLPYPNYADGGRIKAQEGGLMNLGGMEKDYRNEGGFVPIGKEEKADDVPARLSVNEFVFTADAVRNAGGGDIDKGAEVMENVMKNLENGGRISEETQGNTGAQEMFSVSERIGEVI